MRVRWVAVAFVLGLAGCESEPPVPERDPGFYPVRADWLVTAPPKTTPHRWYAPGLPPLVGLDPLRADPNAPLDDLANLLAPEVKSRAILDTSDAGLKHLTANPRSRLHSALFMVFGTPKDPTIGMSGAKIGGQMMMREAVAKEPGRKAEDRETLENEIAELKELQKNVPEHLATLASLELEQETLKRGGVLFRAYCQQCHGLTGDGAGPGGRYLTPLPRDYRQGVFKFISTKPDPGGVRPSRADLHRTIEKGLDGSAMPAFAALGSDAIDSLVSYVIHLSIRGECEYQWLKLAADKTKADEVAPERAMFELSDTLKKLLPVWERSNRTPIEIADDPYQTPGERLTAAARGHAIYLDAAQGGCVSCHTNYGRSAPFAFDVWGGVTKARDQTIATFRVSRQPNDIYTRVMCGIPGVNMPSHADALKVRPEDAAAARNRMWEVVHFVRAISDPGTRRELERAHGVTLK